MDIRIESGVPLPTRSKTGLTAILRKLQVGDSFIAEGIKPTSIRPCADQIGIKISTSKTPEGLRVFRTL